MMSYFPIIATLGMAIIGFTMCFPTIANGVERKPAVALGFAAAFGGLCVMGLIGAWADQKEKLDLEHRIETLSTKADIQETLKNLTGGDAFAYATSEVSGNHATLFVQNDGDYPVYIHHMELTFQSVLKELLASLKARGEDKIPTEETFAARVPFAARELSKHDKQWLAGFILPQDKSRVALTLGIAARNGGTLTKIVFVNSQGHWQTAWIVEGKNKASIPKGFPRQRNNRIAWGP